MRVIHGVWARGALCLWAEDPDLPAGPRDLSPSPAPHPFACQAAELADLLAALPGSAGEAARKATCEDLTLLLPSAGGPVRPLASPELIRPDLPRPGRIRLVGWRVPVLAFAPAAALDLLRAAGDLGELVVPGASLPYLAALARFADGLAARGRVLPVLAAQGRGEGRWVGYAARWRPVLGGTDVQRARDLAAAMPASCRAVAGDPPGVLLAGALDDLVDAAARTRLPGPLLPARRGRTPARLSLAERYVVALTSTDARLDVATPEEEAEAARLATDLDAWLDRAQIPAGPVRTCFRLAEPLGGEAGGKRVGVPPRQHSRRTIRGGSSSPCSPPRTRA